MSTTVNYKGQTLTTVNNETKTLTTSGKWLEGNIELTDVSQSATLGTKAITSNGTYNASSDSLDGYSQVTVNVPTPSPSLQTKSVSYTPTELAQTDTVSADSGYDGLDTVNVVVGAISPSYVGSGITRMSAQSVTPTEQTQTVSTNGKYMTGDVTVNPIPSSYIVPSGSQSITTNGTYDVTALAEVAVNVSGGASYGKYTKLKSGTVTFASRYQTTGNRLICSLADIGFTPTFFMLSATEATIDAICTSLTSGTESNGVIIRSLFVTDSGTSYTFSQRMYERISGTTPSASGGSAVTSWTTQTNMHLYNNGTNIYYRTASNYGLPKDGEYVWLAMA